VTDRSVSILMTLSDPYTEFQGHRNKSNYKSNISKTVRPSEKVTI